MSPRWSGPLRVVLLAGSAACLVVGAGRVPGVVHLTPPAGTAEAAAAASSAPAGSAGSAARDGAATRPVSSATLVCPGPETAGLSGVPADGSATTVLAATAPASALAGVVPDPAPGAAGLLSLRGPGTTDLTTTARGAGLQRGVTGASATEVLGSGALAPGTAAMQLSLRGDGATRGLAAAPCLTARAESWLVAGGGQSTRRERLVLVNPGANTVTADVSVLGASGPLATSGGQDVAVPPHGRTSLLLDALVGSEASPVVHVVASGGVLGALLADSWVDGVTPRGDDDTVPAAGPSTEQVLPGAFVDGATRLRIAVPGDDEAVVQARVLAADGPHPLPVSPVVRVAGGHVLDVDLGTLAAAGEAIQLRADHPIVAGVLLDRRPVKAGGPSDFAWATSTDPVTTLAGTPLPSGTQGSLTLVATGGPASVRVTTLGPTGAERSSTVSVPGDGTASVPLTGPGSVWVTRVSGTVRAAVSLRATDPRLRPGDGPLVTVLGLPPAPVTTTQVPVRRVG